MDYFKYIIYNGFSITVILSQFQNTIMERLLSALRDLGYKDTDIETDLTLDHPLLKQPIAIDCAVLKYGERRYGMIIKFGEISEEAEAELCGICALTGAKYGILTDGSRYVVIKPKDGYNWDYVDGIPSKVELEEELGIKKHLIIAISYDEYESKVDDIGFVIDNSGYVYSDMDRDEVVIVHPNAKLVRWLMDKNVRFREFEDEDFRRLFDLD